MSSGDQLDRRLDFMQLDREARGRIAGLEKTILQALPGALDAFYMQVSAFPETKAFFGSTAHMEGAKNRQISHWNRIAKGQFEVTDAFFEPLPDELLAAFEGREPGEA